MLHYFFHDTPTVNPTPDRNNERLATSSDGAKHSIAICPELGSELT